VHEVSELHDFAARIGSVLNEEGPVFAVLEVVAGAPAPQDFRTLHSAETRRRFAAALRNA
jgi:hypothetical protein